MAGCFYCGLDTSGAHPTCGRPGCSVQVHGHGEGGKTVYNYCDTHRSGGGG